MSHAMREYLEQLLAEEIKLLGETDWDFLRLEKWHALREEIFTRLRDAELPTAEDERTAVCKLIADLLRVDATIITRLQGRLAELSRHITAAHRFRRSHDEASSHVAALLQQIV